MANTISKKPRPHKRVEFFQSGNELVTKDSMGTLETKSHPVKNSTSHPPTKSKPYNPHKKHSSKKPFTVEEQKEKFSNKGNFAFIDGQNLNKSIQLQGWKLDYREFRRYLEEKYNVKKAYMFIGMVSVNQQLYSALQDFGYHLVFKPTIANKFGEIKGNVDAEMVLYALTQINQYNKAVIVSADGDFYTLVQYLQSQGKLEKLLVPSEKAYSALYDTIDIDVSFVDDMRRKLEYTHKSKNTQK